jgi:hypothetical protein
MPVLDPASPSDRYESQRSYDRYLAPPDTPEKQYECAQVTVRLTVEYDINNLYGTEEEIKATAIDEVKRYVRGYTELVEQTAEITG